MKLTPDEIHLLREIVQWRRDQRVDYWRARPPIGRFHSWRLVEQWVTVDFPRVDDAADAYALMSLGGKDFEAHTITEAVDLLVARGVLPHHFASSYRAGYDAGRRHANVGVGNVRDEYLRAERPAHPESGAYR